MFCTEWLNGYLHENSIAEHLVLIILYLVQPSGIKIFWEYYRYSCILVSKPLKIRNSYIQDAKLVPRFCYWAALLLSNPVTKFRGCETSLSRSAPCARSWAVTGGEQCSTPTAGASPLRPACSWARVVPSSGITAVEIQVQRVALFEGWKIAVGLIPSHGAFWIAFIIHDSLDDREGGGESRPEGRTGPYFNENWDVRPSIMEANHYPAKQHARRLVFLF